MANKIKYNDILDHILEEKHSKCICPKNFLSSLKVQKPQIKNKTCQFGPFCEFSQNCNYDQAKCTCYPKCICGPDDLLSLPAAEVDSVPCDDPACICVGTCLCKSDDSLFTKTNYSSPPNCDKAKCVCATCLCQHDDSKNNLLPSYFRNTVKHEAHKLMSNTKMQQEREEIKQLLNEHEENKKKQNEKSAIPQSDAEDETNNTIQSEPSPKFREDEKKPSVNIIEPEAPGPQVTISQTTPIPISDIDIKKTSGTRKPSKSRKKEKINKRKSPKHAPSTKVKSPTLCSRRSSSKARPLRMRFYYSGGTENYGVKLGHQHCLVKPLTVPKHMGWLWSYEDSSKGIRGRKAGPPGYIGKSIKNMMTILKNSHKKPGDVVQGNCLLNRWKTYEYESEDLEPKEEPPLLHIHKKGKVYNITFCPKDSDEDVGPIPIPFTITEKKRESDSESSDSTLEFELHSPKPRRKFIAPQSSLNKNTQSKTTQGKSEAVTTAPPSTTTVPSKQPKRNRSKKSRGSQENKIEWEEQQTHIQNIT